MVDWAGLLNPVEGGWQMGGGTSAGLLGANSQLYPYLGDIGAGLLASSGPSLAPQGGLGARFGGAMQYAGQRQGERLQNETRRMALSQAAEQRKAEAKFRELMAAGGDPVALKSAAGEAYPELVAKSLFPQPLDPDTQVRIMEIQQRMRETGAASGTPSAATARAVGTLADVFDTAEKEGNPFAPGGAFSSQGLLAKAGLSAPETVKGLPDAWLKPFGDPATLKRQAGQALLIDKETQTITQNLTQLADKGTGRSATAINNLNTSLGVGNTPIPVRRNAILGALEAVIDDVEARGVEVEPEWYKLRERLREQTKDITKGGEAGNAAFNVQPTSPPLPVTAPPGFSGIATPPPGAVEAAGGPAAPAPLVPPRPVTTLPLNAQGIPTFNRKADLDRAEKAGRLKGVTAIELNGKTYDWVPE